MNSTKIEILMCKPFYIVYGEEIVEIDLDRYLLANPDFLKEVAAAYNPRFLLPGIKIKGLHRPQEKINGVMVPTPDEVNAFRRILPFIQGQERPWIPPLYNCQQRRPHEEGVVSIGLWKNWMEILEKIQPFEKEKEIVGNIIYSQLQPWKCCMNSKWKGTKPIVLHCVSCYDSLTFLKAANIEYVERPIFSKEIVMEWKQLMARLCQRHELSINFKELSFRMRKHDENRGKRNRGCVKKLNW